jgi:serine/alanine adding enzyme
LSLREVEQDGWDALLDRLGLTDAYLRHGYVEASCVLDGGEPTLLYDGGEVVFPCSVREIPGTDQVDVITPYGYGGPVSSGGSAAGFWERYQRWCGARRVVSTFIRFHPLYKNHRGAEPNVRLERLADTIAWPIGGDSDPRGTLHRHHRRLVRRAEREIDVVVHASCPPLDDFAALYEEGMRLLGASSFYLFPAEYWERLSAGLGESLIQVDGVVDDEVVASTLCLATPPWLHYHLGTVLEAGRSVGASHRLLLEAARWGHRNSCEVFHLGGGVGGAKDSLWEYKYRFAPDELVEAWIGKAVHDEAAYLELSGAERLDFSGLFPAYREPRGSVTRGA